ncbi:hypothetical protein P153DRAFT_426049 [Dothidotthia symphoricarpi CBS 119687]|uniref:Uncharacterized protein n=1 Tax=Dothidotthia symphoricarpi CBS 119687 TaxID=1392245 RepID=A0A6A6A1H3_9PLEO|nr:uncharacterized protein P153DRAFT_426049 [Dothidotthia symphoricarpi CBS 119687]KAF2125023.1 hypothetical protein P153DRAFT_426049 [Dothidotthia symphoricarpi CBS 119687]
MHLLHRAPSPWHLLALSSLCATALSSSSQGQVPLHGADDNARGYNPGEPIPVSCLNRTIDTGEHVKKQITDINGHLQYIPFPTCNETNRPLELFFGVEKDINCTLDFVTDEFFHLLEFYIHNDAPLSCRIPSRPLPASALLSTQLTDEHSQEGALGTSSTLYTPLIIALAGTLQLSHLHVGNNLNLLLHAGTTPGAVDAATAYSVAAHTRSTKITIGDPLPLSFSVRWYPSTTLPRGWAGYGGHVYTSTFIYCILSAGASAAICVAYFRGVELPRRLKRYATDRMNGGGARFGGGGGGGSVGYGLPVANGRGSGYGLSGGYGYGGGIGKKD